MIRNIFPLMLLFILVNPITRISDGETFFQDNSETLLTLSFQSSKILADFQGEDKMDTQRDESSPRALIHHELESNRINNLKINDEPDIGDVSKSYSGIEEKALLFNNELLPKNSRAFLMSTDIRDVSRVVATLFVHSVKLCKLCYTPSPKLMVSDREISQHLAVDKVIKLSSLPAIRELEAIKEWEKQTSQMSRWRTR